MVDELGIGQPVLFQDLGETLARAVGPRGDDDPASPLTHIRRVIRESGEDILGPLPLRREVPTLPRAEIDDSTGFCAALVVFLEGRQPGGTERRQALAHLARRHVETVGFDGLVGGALVLAAVLHAPLAGLVVIDDLRPPCVQRLARLVVENERHARDVVEQRIHRLVEER